MRHIDNKVEDEQTYLKQVSTPLQESSHYPSPPSTTTTTSPPSPSSSPTHEFSFTVSLHPLPPPTTTYDTNNNHKTNTTTTTTLQPPPPLQPPAAIDLSPADDIFLHGHLLPLHHPISHLPDSPRSSTNSMDSFTLPINLLYHHSNPIGNASFHCHHHTTFSDSDEPDVTTTTPTPPKPKPFSIFNIPKWKKRPDNEISTDEDQTKDRTTKKLKLDLSQLIKKYMKMVKPLLSFPKSTKRSKYSNSTRYKYNNHQSYSYSSNSLSRKQPVDMMSKVGRRRGQFSAPASMRASPANSGILLASGCVSPAKSTSESTMEELHAAIQAAIAHCKNSIAIEDKVHESQRS